MGAAYNTTAGNGIIDVIQPGETITINRNGNFIEYHRLIQNGEEDNMTLIVNNLTVIQTTDNKSTPSMSFISTTFCILAAITLRKNK